MALFQLTQNWFMQREPETVLINFHFLQKAEKFLA
jgi:hypothetical protein